MGIRYTISRCPNCNKTLDISNNLDLIGNLIKASKKSRTFGICPACRQIYKTGFIIDESLKEEQKIEYLESINYDNQKIKEIEFSYYNIECVVNFESVKWWYKIMQSLKENGQMKLYYCTKNKKIILKNNDILQIEDLTLQEKEIIDENKEKLLDTILKIVNINIKDIVYIINYTSIEEVRNLENEIDPNYKKVYNAIFKGGEEQIMGLLRSIRKILFPAHISANGLMQMYLPGVVLYYTNKSFTSMYNILKQNYKEEFIIHFFSIMYYHLKHVYDDVNTEIAQKIMKEKVFKKVKKLI